MHGVHPDADTFDVVVDGTLMPGHTAGQVTTALIQKFGLSASEASDLLGGEREVVKAGVDEAMSQTYVRALRSCGLVARAERVVQAPASWPGMVHEPSLTVDYEAAYVTATPEPPPPPQPRMPIEEVAPARKRSDGWVGWTLLSMVVLSALLLGFGEAFSSWALGILLVTVAVSAIPYLWLMSMIWSEGSPAWAVVAFLFSPAILVFVVRRWDIARAPFLLYLACSVLQFSAATAMPDDWDRGSGILSGCGGSFTRTDEENQALDIGRDDSLSDEEAIEQVVAICTRPGSVMEFELFGEPGDYEAYVAYERTGKTTSGTQRGFRDTLMRELGRVSVCVLRATEHRGLEFIDYKQKIDTGPVTIEASVDRVVLDEQVPNWRETTLTISDSISELHRAVGMTMEVESDWLHGLHASDK